MDDFIVLMVGRVCLLIFHNVCVLSLTCLYMVSFFVSQFQYVVSITVIVVPLLVDACLNIGILLLGRQSNT